MNTVLGGERFKLIGRGRRRCRSYTVNASLGPKWVQSEAYAVMTWSVRIKLES